MIKQLHLKNFRSHENDIINFHEGFNVIIGEGCSGKTDIIRAIKLLNWFRPINFRYHSHFAKNKTTSVKFISYENSVVELIKTKSTAKYIIKLPNSKKQEFRKFKSTVPKEVSRIINLDKINFKFQFDQPFIVSESSSRITKIINEVTGIEKIDGWIKIINTKIKENKLLLSNAQNELETANNEIKRYSKLNEIKKLIDKYTQLNQKIEKTKNKYEYISNYVRSMKRSKRKIKIIKKVLNPLEKCYNLLLEKNKQIEKTEKKIELVESYIDTNNHIEELKKQLKNMTNKFISILKKKKRCPLCMSKITNKIIRDIIQ